MAVSSQVPEFISSSLAGNIRSLLAQISKLVADSAESVVKRSSVEAADEQLCEIKKLRREEPKLPRLRKIWPLEVQMFMGFSFCFEICSGCQLLRNGRKSSNDSPVKEADFVGEAILELFRNNRIEQLFCPSDIINPLSVSVQRSSRRGLF